MSRGVCLFGGSFNPPHRTHRRLLLQAREHLDPARLVVMPCAANPLKSSGELAASQHRVAMCRLALADIPTVEISALEIDRGGPSFTVDTVRALRAQLGLEDPLWLLCGSDILAELDAWKDRHTLLELATLVVFPRIGHPLDESTLDRVAIRRKHKEEILANAMDVAADAVNATALRRALGRGEAPDDLAPEVIAYARTHGLYQIPDATR